MNETNAQILSIILKNPSISIEAFEKIFLQRQVTTDVVQIKRPSPCHTVSSVKVFLAKQLLFKPH